MMIRQSKVSSNVVPSFHGMIYVRNRSSRSSSSSSRCCYKMLMMPSISLVESASKMNIVSFVSTSQSTMKWWIGTCNYHLRRSSSSSSSSSNRSSNSGTTITSAPIGSRLLSSTSTIDVSSNSSTISSSTTGSTKSIPKKKKRSLALTVNFLQPNLGMTEYEILIRGTAFLIGIDPKETSIEEKPGPYGHLDASVRLREENDPLNKEALQYHPGTRASTAARGPPGRKMMELNWLEFVPKEVRPQVHIVCASHVLSPFLWREYYPQDWLGSVKQEHVMYLLEVIENDDDIDDDNNKYDNENGSNSSTSTTESESKEHQEQQQDSLQKKSKSIAQFELNPQPFHHPEGRDIALVHFKEERKSLLLLKKLGIEILYLRNQDKLYKKGEEMYFDGYILQESDTIDSGEYNTTNTTSTTNTAVPTEAELDGNKNDVTTTTTTTTKDNANEDNRVFYHCIEKGNLSFHANDRFFATTTKPLSMGFCGAPVLDNDGDCCGTVEGIVPISHPNPNLAGNAAFVPSYIMKVFIDYVERGLLEQMMPKDLFQTVVIAKKTNSIGGGISKADGHGTYSDGNTNVDEAYDIAIESLKRRYKPEEFDAIMATVERERKEVLEIMDKEEDSDINEIMGRVRMKTMQIRELVKGQYSKQVQDEEVQEEQQR